MLRRRSFFAVAFFHFVYGWQKLEPVLLSTTRSVLAVAINDEYFLLVDDALAHVGLEQVDPVAGEAVLEENGEGADGEGVAGQEGVEGGRARGESVLTVRVGAH